MRILSAVPAAAAACAVAGAGSGQCEPRWSEEFEAGLDGPVHAIEAGAGAIYVGGEFFAAGGEGATRVAAYEDGVWSGVGAGFPYGYPYCTTAAVFALLEISLPEATGVIAGGAIATWAGPGSMIARWDGVGWRVMGEGMQAGATHTCGAVRSVAVFDDGAGPALYASGIFHIPANCVARWNGSQWEDVGGGPAVFVFEGGGNAMAAHDDGTGPALYVGGNFSSGAGSSGWNIARWRPAQGWEALAAGLDLVAEALLEVDDGGERVLLAAGGAGATGQVLRRDGAGWSQLGGTFNGRVRALAEFDDGAGPAVYAGGEFTSVDGRTIRRLAKWDGAEWAEVAGGANGPVYALEPAAHDSVWTLLAGGDFTAVGDGVSSQRIARLIGCRDDCYADCDGSGELDFFDFVCFQNAFAAMAPYADCDGSGEHDFFDFLCFQNTFAAGCE